MLQTICQKTPKDSAQYEECKKALQAVSKVCAMRYDHKNPAALNEIIHHLHIDVLFRNLWTDETI